MTKEKKTVSPKNTTRQLRERLHVLLNNQHHIARLVIIAASLLLFLELLPSSIRAALLHGLLTYRYLSALLISFSLLALSLLWSTGQQIDTWIFRFFNFEGKRPFWLDTLMLAFTQLGNGLIALVVSLILFFINFHRLAYELILGTLTLWLLVELVKVFIHRSRPYSKLIETRVVGRRERGRSFPSGHTSQAFFLGSLLAQHFHVGFWAGAILYTLALLVAITRMYVGAHFPRDVFAGAVLGSIWGMLGVIVDAHFLAV